MNKSRANVNQHYKRLTPGDRVSLDFALDYLIRIHKGALVPLTNIMEYIKSKPITDHSSSCKTTFSHAWVQHVTMAKELENERIREQHTERDPDKVQYLDECVDPAWIKMVDIEGCRFVFSPYVGKEHISLMKDVNQNIQFYLKNTFEQIQKQKDKEKENERVKREQEQITIRNNKKQQRWYRLKNISQWLISATAEGFFRSQQ